MKRSSWWDYSDVKVVKSWLIKEVLLASNDAARLIDVPVAGQPNSFLMELSIKGLKLFHEMVSLGVFPDTMVEVKFWGVFEDLRLRVLIEDNQLTYALTCKEGEKRRQLPTPTFKKWGELIDEIESLWGVTTKGFICYEDGSPKALLLDQGILNALQPGITWVPSIREFVRKR
jgi:hypothetical protein